MRIFNDPPSEVLTTADAQRVTFYKNDAGQIRCAVTLRNAENQTRSIEGPYSAVGTPEDRQACTRVLQAAVNAAIAALTKDA